jgi:hypothetical protein
MANKGRQILIIIAQFSMWAGGISFVMITSACRAAGYAFSNWVSIFVDKYHSMHLRISKSFGIDIVCPWIVLWISRFLGLMGQLNLIQQFIHTCNCGWDMISTFGIVIFQFNDKFPFLAQSLPRRKHIVRYCSCAATLYLVYSACQGTIRCASLLSSCSAASWMRPT